MGAISKFGVACVVLVMSALVASDASVHNQNLTTYLLTRYASRYHRVLTQPTFYQKVLAGTADPAQVAYFFEQDTIYGRGFTSLCGNALNLLTESLTAPTSNRTLTAIDNLGETASGLADEDGRLTSLRNQLIPGTASQPLHPSEGTREYVRYMKQISSPPNDPFLSFVCSWTMGKAFVDVWTNIQQNQTHKPNPIPELQTIIDYWADPSYVASIDATGDLINTWFDGHPWPHSADRVFLDTLQREADFWVSVDNFNGRE